MTLKPGWRKLPDDKLQELADTLKQRGMEEDFDTVQGELDLREDEAELSYASVHLGG